MKRTCLTTKQLVQLAKVITCLIVLLVAPSAIKLSVSIAADYVVTANTLNVRSAPSISSKVIGTLNKGDIISDVSYLPNDWLCIQQTPTEKGYISTKHLKKVEGPSAGEIKQQEQARREKYLLKIEEAKSKLRWCFAIWGIIFVINWLLTKADVFSILLLALLMAGLPCMFIYYFFSTPYSMWFLYPSVIGWGWTIGNAFLFVMLLFMGGMACIDGLKALFDWFDPLFSLITIATGVAYGYAIYLLILAINAQVPEAFLLLFSLLGGGGKSVVTTGSLRDHHGHDVDGHFGSNGDFYGKDGNTYKKDWGDGSWHREN